MLMGPNLQASSENTEFASPPSIQPPPLFVPTSRARRRFAERLAERQRALQGHDEEEEDDADPSANPNHHDALDLADATDEISLDDMDDAEVHQIALHSEPLELDDDDDDDLAQFGKRHPEDHTSAWHDPERTESFDDDDDVGLVIGGGLGGGDGSSGAGKARRRSGSAERTTAKTGAKGPGRFSGLFAGGSDSD